MALASISKAMEVWSNQVCSSILPDENKSELVPLIKLIKLAATFFSEASVDLIKLIARLMSSAIIARRALWLRPWMAHPASKTAWCKISDQDQMLFGGKLDAAISKATGGKSGSLP